MILLPALTKKLLNNKKEKVHYRLVSLMPVKIDICVSWHIF